MADDSTRNSSFCTPVQASTVRKNGYAMLQGYPCQIKDMSSAKTGKHGGTKIHFIGVDIFTGKKKEEIVGSGDNIEEPVVTKSDFTMCDLNADGYLTLMDDDGETREDLKLPEDAELAESIKKAFEEGGDGDIVVNVMSAMGQEQIVAVTVRRSGK